jgi:hypothetical protein
MSFLKWIHDKTNSPSVKVSLNLDKNQYALGDQINGELTILSDEEFEVSQVVIWLTCRESIKKSRVYGGQYENRQTEYWDSADIYKSHSVITGGVRFPYNYAGRHKFSFIIPSVCRETFYSVDHYVKWFLHPDFAVVGRPCFQSNYYEISVLRQQTNQTTVTKEITREVVLIPCSYCNGLMPQTAIFCPNCGARRKT